MGSVSSALPHVKTCPFCGESPVRSGLTKQLVSDSAPPAQSWLLAVEGGAVCVLPNGGVFCPGCACNGPQPTVLRFAGRIASREDMNRQALALWNDLREAGR